MLSGPDLVDGGRSTFTSLPGALVDAVLVGGLKVAEISIGTGWMATLKDAVFALFVGWSFLPIAILLSHV